MALIFRGVTLGSGICITQSDDRIGVSKKPIIFPPADGTEVMKLGTRGRVISLIAYFRNTTKALLDTEITVWQNMKADVVAGSLTTERVTALTNCILDDMILGNYITGPDKFTATFNMIFRKLQ